MAMARPNPVPRDTLVRFLRVKARTLASRAHKLVALTPEAVGLRPEDMPYAPRAEHFAAANKRLQAINRAVQGRLAELGNTADAKPEDQLLAMAMVEREIDRARRAFGMFFEVFAQRGTAFNRRLAAHDAISIDCYDAIRQASPRTFRGPIVPPLTYLEHGYSPATMRRGVALSRLLGETNPFPLIRIPYDRDRPWQAVFLHEVAHNLQADLGLWVQNRDAVIQRLAEERAPPLVISIFGRWHKEIFADLAALLLGGPASAWGLATFLAHPADKVMTYRPGGAHPTGFLRAQILAEMLHRMKFEDHARNLRAVWKRLYDPRRGHRIPALLLNHAKQAIAAVVDEIAFQPRRALAERALATIIPFGPHDHQAIRAGGEMLARLRAPRDLPPRFLVSAAAHAIEKGVDPRDLNELVLDILAPREQPTDNVITLKAA